MTKRKSLLLTLLMVMVTACCALFASCDLFAQKVAVTWELDENAIVKVVGYEEVPKEVAVGATLEIEASAKTGYKVKAVYFDGTRTSPDKETGKYSVTVEDELTVKVETQRTIESVAITKKPAKDVYYAGESVDKAEMEVTVTYGNGDTEKITSGYTISPSVFAIGDKGYKVTYSGVSSETVAVPEVEALVTIDTAGGVVDEAYITAFAARTDIKNFAINTETGIATFTFSALEAEIVLPTAEQITKGEEVGDYTFKGWKGGASIPADATTSMTFEAQYEAKLLVLNSIKYQEIDGVPYLVANGTFKAARTAYLYLYEGKDKVELVGDTIGGENTQRGESFELKFDMNKLVAAGYEGKWMDIKFCAALGDRIETMEFDLFTLGSEFVDLSQVLINGTYSFSFQTYEENGTNTLKAVYIKLPATYTISSEVVDGVTKINFSGTAADEYKGKKIVLDYWAGTKVTSTEGTIAEDGTWTVSFNADDVPMNTDGYFHITIQEADGTMILPESGEKNLANDGLIAEGEGFGTYSVGLINNNSAFRLPNADESKVIYIGKGKWGGMVLYARNESISVSGASLIEKDGKAYMAINGTYSEAFENAAAVEAMIKQNYTSADFQNYPSNGFSTDSSWTQVTLTYGSEKTETEEAVPATIIIVVNDDNTWQLLLDMSEAKEGQVLYFHVNGKDLKMSAIDATQTATANGLTISFFDSYTDGLDSWLNGLLMVKVSAAA